MSVLSSIDDGWRRCWVNPVSAASLCVLRVATGLIVLGWCASVVPDFASFFGPHGIVRVGQGSGMPPDLPWLPDERLGGVWAAWGLLVASAISLTLGWHARLAAAATWLLLGALQLRNPFILDAGDALLRMLVLFLALGDCGAWLSLDARRRGVAIAPPRAPLISPVALRLVQVQVCVMYAAAAWSKLAAERWRDGTALAWALRVPELQRLPVPDVLLHASVVVTVLTLGTIAFELSFPILVWSRRARPWLLAAGIVLHVAIDATLLVGFFSLAVLAAYVSFVPPARFERLAGAPAAAPTPHPRARHRSRLRMAAPLLLLIGCAGVPTVAWATHHGSSPPPAGGVAVDGMVLEVSSDRIVLEATDGRPRVFDVGSSLTTRDLQHARLHEQQAVPTRLRVVRRGDHRVAVALGHAASSLSVEREASVPLDAAALRTAHELTDEADAWRLLGAPTSYRLNDPDRQGWDCWRWKIASESRQLEACFDRASTGRLHQLSSTD